MNYAVQVHLGDLWHFVQRQGTSSIFVFEDFGRASSFLAGTDFGAPARLMMKGEDGRWTIAAVT